MSSSSSLKGSNDEDGIPGISFLGGRGGGGSWV